MGIRRPPTPTAAGPHEQQVSGGILREFELTAAAVQRQTLSHLGERNVLC